MRSLVITTVLLAGCRSSAPTPSIPNRDIAEISARSGAVSAKLLEDPTAPGVQLGPGEEYRQPQLNPDNPFPEYPAALIGKSLPIHVVAARVTFDEEGCPIDIAGSPLRASTEDQYTPYFVGEVRKAVATWKCWPPRIRKFRPGPDTDGDGKPDYRILSAEKVLKTYFDVSFSFEVVNGVPVVKGAPAN
ncbi:MAG TPA: hypothetical protein VLV78_07385 [Thermoanaerobaculia bacterium]|nr:hypothetical protein [Thermoanaerobaculia bacterium]